MAASPRPLSSALGLVRELEMKRMIKFEVCFFSQQVSTLHLRGGTDGSLPALSVRRPLNHHSVPGAQVVRPIADAKPFSALRTLLFAVAANSLVLGELGSGDIRFAVAAEQEKF